MRDATNSKNSFPTWTSLAKNCNRPCLKTHIAQKFSSGFVKIK